MGLPANTDPVALANASLKATNQGSWLNIINSGISNVGDAVAGAYQSRVAMNNAALAERDAQAALEAGQAAAEREKMKTGELIGSQKVQQAAGNVDVSSGSAARVRDATQALGDYDAQVIQYNAARRAYAARTEAQSYRAQGALGFLKTGLDIVGGTGRTYDSFLSRSNALANAAYGFRQTGVPIG